MGGQACWLGRPEHGKDVIQGTGKRRRGEDRALKGGNVAEDTERTKRKRKRKRKQEAEEIEKEAGPGYSAWGQAAEDAGGKR